MTFVTPIGLVALLTIPAIVAIHLFRRRFPRRAVAGLFLWQSVRQTPEGGGKITRLPITTSLILECLAALALALILAGARLSPASVSEHLVVLLDDSASMAAVNGAGESTRDRAVRRVIAEMDRLGAGARITIVQSGIRPSVLSGPAALDVEARPALHAWTPEAPGHSLALGLRLARELAGTNGKLMVVSDVPPAQRGEPGFVGGLWAAVGERLGNVGITAAQRTPAIAEGRGAMSLTLANHADASAKRQLVVSAGEKNILTRDLDVPPGTSSLSIPLPANIGTVRVALSDDALVRDNAVVLAEPRPHLVGVENHLREGRGRDALVRALGALSGVTQAAAGHLAFADAATLDKPASPGLWRVGFGRPPAAWVRNSEATDFIGPFVLEKRHPLLLGMTLGGVVWTGATPLAANTVRPLVSAGDQVLIGAIGGQSTDPAILVNLDLDRTNLIRAPDWPVLISNIVEIRRQNLPGPERWNYRVGEWVRVRLAADPKSALRVRSAGVERPLPAARQLEFLAPSPGGALQILDGEDVLLELGVNFLDESETDLRRQATADSGAFVGASGLRAESGPESDPLFWLLLTIAGLAILANWCLLPALARSERRAY
ncbi:MAG TPA: BatA and WFA domain-containing protein [Vicinamibacterales bacterium]|jgi:hypothetical protein|nr:BatA and WFA domain-containing protein [Vicinamibacterales bacterium]